MTLGKVKEIKNDGGFCEQTGITRNDSKKDCWLFLSKPGVFQKRIVEALINSFKPPGS
jgi:hypothetical protein